MSSYDAVIVGARCAGATLGIELARGGWSVLMVDRGVYGSDTLSTHAMFPNTLVRLEQLGVLERLRSEHEVPFLGHRLRILGREIAGRFTAIGGYDRAIGPRRAVLDKAFVDSALAAGAEARFETRVTGLMGTGTEADPVRGVVLDDGEEIEAAWVFGADGRASRLARLLGLANAEPLAGEMEFLLAYWSGLPATEYIHNDVREDLGVSWVPCEDGTHMLGVFGRAGFARGNAEERAARLESSLRSFPDTLDPDWLEDAERITEVRVAPETMLRGFFRHAHGPGWALVGDAGHFKHPATAQGISDAIEQAIHVAGSLTNGGGLEGYERWRDDRAAGHYEFSFDFGRFPRPELAGPVFGGLAEDDDAAQDFRDVFSRALRPREALSPERMKAWFAAAAA